MRLGYDPAKRERTLRERGLDFNDAATVFAGFHLTRPDTRFDYGEERRITVGSLEDMVVVLVWTARGDERRIISMRKAARDERDHFQQQLDRSG